MFLVGQLIEAVLWIFIVLLLARLVAEWVQVFARSWSPTGVLAVVLEAVYTTTDPPVRLLRRFIPPLRIGQVAVDLSFLLVLIACYVLLQVNRGLLLS